MRTQRILIAPLALAILWTGSLRAATPTPADALKLRPIQADVDYDTPDAGDLEKCTIKAEKSTTVTGWTVLGPAGQVLRRFLDTNRDGVVDRWCYYKSGLEVYRDTDTNFNRKADESRWLNTGGTRRGIDRNEDGKIDHWQSISAEEVTQEAVAALTQRDAARFAALLPTAAELGTMGLGETQRKKIDETIQRAPAAFNKIASERTGLTDKTRWVHFGGTQPGVVPEGTDGSTKDIVVYENVVAMVETGGKHDQIFIGTLARIGDAWRLIDAPRTGGDLAEAGIFFQSPIATTPQPSATAVTGASGPSQALLAELEAFDKKLAAATTEAQKATVHAQRSDLLEKLAADAKNTEEKSQWIRQIADMVSVAVQAGEYPDGTGRLKQLIERLQKEKALDELTAYVQFRYLSADYGQQLQANDADFAKVQAAWLESLTGYVEQYPKSTDAADAMLQLAVGQEFSGKEDDAAKWYGRIVTEHPKSVAAKKAAGAKLRLESVGKTIALRGETIDGKSVDLAKYKGRVVLIHYWATWCEPCKSDMEQLKALQKKYEQRGFSLIGVSFDENAQTLASTLRRDPLAWAQIHESGGLDGRLANELGILTLPTMLLVDEEGKVVNRNIHVSEIEAELKKRIR